MAQPMTRTYGWIFRVFPVLTLCVWIPSVFASMWVDPAFEDMVAHSELIVICKVTKGGPWSAEVVVEEVLKGKKPDGPLKVAGYNNYYWPQYAVEKESMKTGERFLLFLSRGEYVLHGVGLDAKSKIKYEGIKKAGIFDEKKLEQFKKSLSKPLYGEMWAVPTPSSGCWLISDGKVSGRWFDTSYNERSPSMPLKLVTTMIRGLLDHGQGEASDEARKLIRKHLTKELVTSIRQPTKEREWNGKEEEQYLTAEWLLCAQSAFGEPKALPAVQAASTHTFVVLNALAGKALSGFPENKVSLAMAERLLGMSVSGVQSETAQALIRGKYTARKAGSLVVKALVESSAFRKGPDNLMTPVRNFSSSGRESMIRAITHFGVAKEAHDYLVKLIIPEGLNSGVFEALRAHFLKYPSADARKRFIALAVKAPRHAVSCFAEYFAQDRHQDSVTALNTFFTDKDVSVLDQSRWLRMLCENHGLRNPVVVKALRDLAKKDLDSYFEATVLAYLIHMKQAVDVTGIRKKLLESSISIEYRARCLELLILSNGPGTRMAEEVLLKYLKKHSSEAEVLACTVLLPTKEVVAQLKAADQRKSTAATKLALDAIQLIKNPPETPGKRVDAWFQLLRREADIGDFEVVLWYRLANTAATAKAQLVERLRKEIRANTRPALPVLALLKALDPNLSESENAALKNARARHYAYGGLPKVKWDAIFADAIKQR